MHIFQASNPLYSRCETNVSGLPDYIILISEPHHHYKIPTAPLAAALNTGVEKFAIFASRKWYKIGRWLLITMDD